jgi:hypothetical protein
VEGEEFAMSAAARQGLASQLERLIALVSALRQLSDNAGASRLGMAAVLLENKREVLSDEF